MNLRTTNVSRRIDQDRIHFFSESRISVKHILGFEIGKRDVPDEAMFLRRRLQHLYRRSRLRLGSAGIRGKCVDSVLLFHLTFQVCTVFCSRLYSFSALTLSSFSVSVSLVLFVTPFLLTVGTSSLFISIPTPVV